MSSLRFASQTLAGVVLLIIVAGCQTPPVVPGKPTGLSAAALGVPVMFGAMTTDPAGLQVSYQFDWGDRSTSQWSAFVPGDTAVSDTHTYTKAGQVQVRARAKNSKNGVSGWSDTLQVLVAGGESTQKWFYMYYSAYDDDSVSFVGSVATSVNGSIIYAVSDFGVVNFIDQNGGYRGTPFQVQDQNLTGSPSVSPDNRCYVGDDEPKVFAVLPNGTTAPSWPVSINGEIQGFIAVDNQENIYFNCDLSTGGKLYSITSSGGGRWGAPPSTGGGPSSPALSHDGSLVFVGGYDSMIHAFRTSDGGSAWAPIVTGGPISSSPAIGSDGRIYFASEDGKLRQVLPTGGDPVWTYDAHSPVDASPVIGADGYIYVTSNDGVLHAVDPANGQAKWTLPLNCSDPSTAAISSANIIYILGSYTGEFDSLLAINLSDHSRRWSAAVPSAQTPPERAPVIDRYGAVYVTGGEAVYSFWGRGAPAQSAWPMYGHDPQHTGMAQ